MEDLKKAPPPLPKDAFKQPNHEMESPWDTQSSAPAPKAEKQKLALPMWMGRPIAAHDHAQQIDLDAAVNEFGMKMPRGQAEDEAYKQYLYHPAKGQHAQAAMHHLTGMKAAHAAGDMEAARNHSLMYNLHAKALGKSPVDAARELQQHIKDPAKVYKFKAHRGDAFAVQSPEPTTPPPMVSTQNGVLSSAPPPQMSKSEREVLYMLFLMGNAALKKTEVDEPHYDDHDAKKCGSFTCSACKRHMPSCKGGEGTECDDCWAKAHEASKPKAEKSPGKVLQFPTKKGELTANPKAKHCKCTAYHFPHRHGGGKCMVVKP